MKRILVELWKSDGKWENSLISSYLTNTNLQPHLSFAIEIQKYADGYRAELFAFMSGILSAEANQGC